MPSLLSSYINGSSFDPRNPDCLYKAFSYLYQDMVALNQTGAGDLLAANNLSDVQSTSTSLSNLGGAAKSANLSDLTNVGTARTNLGLGGAAQLGVGTTAGTVAAGDDSRITGAAQKSADLSDLASVATARTNLGLTDVSTSSALTKIYASYTPVVDGVVTAFTVTMPAGFGQLQDCQVAVYSDGVNSSIAVRLQTDEFSVLGNVLTCATAPNAYLMVDIFKF